MTQFSSRHARIPLLATAALISAGVATAWAADSPSQLVHRARTTLGSFQRSADFSSFSERLAAAKAVIIVPEAVKGGLVVGGEAGKAVLLARSPNGDAWSYPAFLSITSASLGLQIGGQVSEAVMLVNNNATLASLIDHRFKFGADAAATVIGVGAGIEAAAAADLAGDILVYSRSKGLFAGVSIEGTLLSADDEANAAYYQGPISIRDIIYNGDVVNPDADALRKQLTNG